MHPIWQPDSTAKECYSCSRQFTFFHRRHHCRKCGRVVCGKCSETSTTYLPSTYLVTPANSPKSKPRPGVVYRTCDSCVLDLELIKSVLRVNSSHNGVLDAIVETLALGSDEEDIVDDDKQCRQRCPVCNIKMDPSEDGELHIQTCLDLGTRKAQNRTIVYRLDHDLPEEKECGICFGNFKTGQSVGRLECLCIYHEKCILDWFMRKGVGECPVHTIYD